MLPKDYARPGLDKHRLGELIDLIGTIGLGDAANRSKDMLGRVYEYFLTQFASAEGKNGGQFYTPSCAATDAAIELRDDIAFFQAVRSHLAKTSGSQRPREELNAAVRQLVAGAIMADEGIIDVFAAAGLKRPDISILSDQFLAEVRGLKHKNVAAELLAKLLKDEIKLRSARNIVQSRQFSEMLKATLTAYHNRAIATQEVIEELIKLAREMSAATRRGVDLGLNDDEVAFYDALAANESAVQAMGNDELKVIAAELVAKVRKSVTIDWTLRESARARIRVMVKRILKKHGYPPDLQDEATKTVLAQAELLSASWSACFPSAERTEARS